MTRKADGITDVIPLVLTERFLKPDRSRWSQVEHALRPLRGLCNITRVHVILEKPSEAARYRVFVWLTVPGPDLHAEEWDYTLPAALQKAVENLVQQLRDRAGNRERQRVFREQPHASASRTAAFHRR